jgi:hypothetical protein
MTGRFDTLIYTDCRPGQGLQGSAGLQFQARSSTAVGAATSVVQRHLLYEPPSRWMAERRPVEEYPRSFGHVCGDGFFATAAGVYLGREANGSREGNQLTHSLVTQDPADYQGLRPAQLFGAAFWTDTPAPTTTSAPVDLEAKATAFSPARARDFVQSQPDGRETLLALVSALETAGRPDGSRILFVGDDVAAIMEWLVAGTLLVPRVRALELGFKIFSTDPGRAGVPVVAVPREFAGTAGRIDNQLGYAVFNMDQPGHTPVETSSSARRWVDLFLTEDPQDVVDALDIAAVSELDEDAVAAALGMAAIMHRSPELEHAEPIVGWLRTGPEQLRDAYAADVAELFAETPDRWPQRVLVLLDEVGCDGLIPGRAASVRIALIHSEVEAARERGGVTDRQVRLLPDGEWGLEDANVAKRMLVNALDSGVPPAHVDALLRIASRFRVDVRYQDIPDTVQAFVAYWAEHPESGYDPARWPHPTEFEELLVDQLSARVVASNRQAAVFGPGWWRWLLNRPSLPAQLLAVALGAGVRYSDDRMSFVDRYLASAIGSPKDYAWMVGALWNQTGPTPAELKIVHERAPHDVTLPQNVFNAFVSHLCGTGRVELAEFRLCEDLIKDKLLRPSPELRKVLADDRAVVEAVDVLLKGVVGDDEQSRALNRLCRQPDRLVTMRASRVIDGLLRAGDVRGVVDVLQNHPGLLRPYAAELAETLHTRGSDRPAAVGLCVGLALLDKTDPLREAILDGLRHWLVRASDRRLEGARNRLAPLDRTWRETWDRYVEVTRGRRRRYRLAHPLRGR